MDEQTIQQQELTNSPEPQQDFSQDIQPETENFDDYQEDYQEDFPEPDMSNSDVAIDENGDVNFSDDYLAEQEKHFFSERTEPPTPDEPAQAKYYTDD